MMHKIDHRELPEALQDNPPRPTPGHPAWAIEEGRQIERRELRRRLAIGTLAAAALGVIILVATLATRAA